MVNPGVIVRTSSSIIVSDGVRAQPPHTDAPAGARGYVRAHARALHAAYCTLHAALLHAALLHATLLHTHHAHCTSAHDATSTTV